MPRRAQHQRAYILHRRAYSETSLIFDVFTRDYGRVTLLAKGARRIKSKIRGILRTFSPIYVSFTGKGELQTLTEAEASSLSVALRYDDWYCGYYLNELLIKLLHRHDPHEAIFDAYEAALAALHGDGNRQSILREFEKQLLVNVGYGLVLRHDTSSGESITASQLYQYVPEQGPRIYTKQVAITDPRKEIIRSPWNIHGSTLLALDNQQINTARDHDESKRLLRLLLDQLLQGQQLKSRAVMQRSRVVG